MNKDKALEELFLAQKPHFDDNEAFMASLTKRLDAVEYIKQHEAATIRRYKLIMVLAFVVGIISGGVAIVYMLSMPMEVPLFTFQMQSGWLSWLADNSRLLTTTALSLMVTFGLVSIVSNIQEIRNYRTTCVNTGDSPSFTVT